MTNLNKLSIFFSKEISKNMLNFSFGELISLYYNSYKEFDTKKDFKQDSKTIQIEDLIKGLLKEYPYLKNLNAYGGLK